MAETCASCRFWLPPEVTADPGECHYHAPFPAGDEHQRARWPLTLAGEWCGEQQPIPAELPDQEAPR